MRLYLNSASGFHLFHAGFHLHTYTAPHISTSSYNTFSGNATIFLKKKTNNEIKLII